MQPLKYIINFEDNYGTHVSEVLNCFQEILRKETVQHFFLEWLLFGISRFHAARVKYNIKDKRLIDLITLDYWKDKKWLFFECMVSKQFIEEKLPGWSRKIQLQNVINFLKACFVEFSANMKCVFFFLGIQTIVKKTLKQCWKVTKYYIMETINYLFS